MNKQYLPFLAAILIVFLIFSQGVIAVEAKNKDNFGCPVPGGYQNVTASEAYRMIEKNAFVAVDRLFILDVRTPAEFNYGHIQGATRITLKNVNAHDPVNLSEDQLLPYYIEHDIGLPLNKHTKILVYCKVGKRGAAASQMLADADYKRVYNIEGGIDAWVNATYPIVLNPDKWAVHYPPNP